MCHINLFHALIMQAILQFNSFQRSRENRRHTCQKDLLSDSKHLQLCLTWEYYKTFNNKKKKVKVEGKCNGLQTLA